ncbi:hypothetical protein CRENBAI_023013 [Crenichthys baileyi]|uniref:Uncharacterized protein n=1 Tax=Crenichthys baileyi TaxID=28760 RepID=A0AAV9S351_9TELE
MEVFRCFTPASQEERQQQEDEKRNKKLRPLRLCRWWSALGMLMKIAWFSVGYLGLVLMFMVFMFAVVGMQNPVRRVDWVHVGLHGGVQQGPLCHLLHGGFVRRKYSGAESVSLC